MQIQAQVYQASASSYAVLVSIPRGVGRYGIETGKVARAATSFFVEEALLEKVWKGEPPKDAQNEL